MKFELNWDLSSIVSFHTFGEMSAFHAIPAEGACCACCWDDISAENYVEYQTAVESAWLAAGFCQMCIEQLLSTQYEAYINGLAKSTCKAEQRRMLAKGPPMNLSDKNALPIDDDDSNAEVYMLWYSSDKQEHSAKLKGSLEGEERMKYWDEQKLLYIDEGDEEGKEKEAGENEMETQEEV